MAISLGILTQHFQTNPYCTILHPWTGRLMATGKLCYCAAHDRSVLRTTPTVVLDLAALSCPFASSMSWKRQSHRLSATFPNVFVCDFFPCADVINDVMTCYDKVNQSHLLSSGPMYKWRVGPLPAVKTRRRLPSTSKPRSTAGFPLAKIFKAGKSPRAAREVFKDTAVSHPSSGPPLPPKGKVTSEVRGSCKGRPSTPMMVTWSIETSQKFLRPGSPSAVPSGKLT